MVYGHKDTLYLELILRTGRIMKERTKVPSGKEPFSEVYNYMVGNGATDFYRPDGSKMIQIFVGVFWVTFGLLLMFDGYLKITYETRFLEFKKSSGLYFTNGKDRIHYLTPKNKDRDEKIKLTEGEK